MKIFLAQNEAESKTLLTRILQKYYNLENPHFVTNEHGKPRLTAGLPCFNLSHSGNLAAVAVGNQEVGLDIQMRGEGDYSAILKRMTPAEREEDFFRVWTAKEAYVKYLGSSLSKEYPLLRFCQGGLYRDGERAGVSLFFRETDEYTLCLCTALPCASVEFEEIRL